MYFLASQAYAYDVSSENYVELGEMKNQPSFDVLTPGQVSDKFIIPIYNKTGEKSTALDSLWKDGEKASQNKTSQLIRKLKKLKIYSIPKYTFGREKILKRRNIGWSLGNYQSIKPISLKSKSIPDMLRNLKKKINFNISMAKVRKINLKEINKKVVVQNDIDQIQFLAEDNFKFNILPMYLREAKDHDLLAADILFEEKKSCQEVVPIAQFLEDKVTVDNRVKFYKGMCLHDYKMFSESIPLLSQVIGTSTDYYIKKAVDKILTDLPQGYEGIIAKELTPKKVYDKLDQKQKDKYNYILAKGNFINEKYRRAEAHAKSVSHESEDKYDAKFILSTAQYMSGRLPQGIKTMENLKTEYLKSRNQSSDFNSLINVTLARFQFERGDYKKAIKNYELVSREHPLWVDSLIEKGWAQIKLGDFSGAIGNMFTLHSPFFKDAFIPESYVIRTIGYLNLCQFGDANSTLGYLETEYPDQKRKVMSFLEEKKNHYETLLGYLKANSEKLYEFNTLPASTIREMGRDRDFLMTQMKLNNIVDEIPIFRAFAVNIMDKRKILKDEIAKLTKESKKLRVKEGKALKNNKLKVAKTLKKKRKSIFNEGFSLNYRIKLFDKGIVAYKKANGDAVERAEKMRDDYLIQAEKALEESLGNIDTRLETVLRNNDLLRYEIFANSGKNIRYRVAGGNINESAGSSRKPAKVRSKKSYGWEFKGEFWQDEVGNFKSSLTNLCPRK